jgi:cysteine-rich repeat protein
MLLPFLLFACAQTGPTTTAGADEACVLACVKGGGLYSPCSCLCDPLCERTASAELPLTPTLQARYILADDNAPGTATACNDANNGDWCKCGTDYTNAAASCVEIGATMFLEYEAPGVPVAPGARLKFDATVSTTNNPSGVDVTMRRIKPAVTRPTMGQAGYCPTTSQASWFRAGPTAWALPGAKGDGTDRTTIEATRTDGTGAPANGTAGAPLGNHIAKNDNQVTYYWDVTALLNDCPAAGMCVLALYMDAGTHINVLGGTTALEYFPAGPVPVCGDGAVAGSETCDDSNATAGDGCSALCAVEAGYGCSGAPSACATTCGDGVKAGAEECDNGAANGSNAPCSAACAAQACGCSPP